MMFKIYAAAGTRQYTNSDIQLLRELRRLNLEAENTRRKIGTTFFLRVQQPVLS